MVLDDVVLSIDLGHARRLLTLLRDEFKDHQLLIFTHNGLFARWCLGLIPGVKKVELLGWTLETGPRISDYASSIDRLKQHIETSPPKEIAMNMMWLMDEWLAECRFAFALSVPAKLGEEYTLTDIWEPFAKVLRDLVKHFGDVLLNVSKYLDALRDVPRIRNMLAAHENEFAQEFPRNDYLRDRQQRNCTGRGSLLHRMSLICVCISKSAAATVVDLPMWASALRQTSEGTKAAMTTPLLIITINPPARRGRPPSRHPFPQNPSGPLPHQQANERSQRTHRTGRP